MAFIHWDGNVIRMLDQGIAAIERSRLQLDRGIWQWCTSNRVLLGLLALLVSFLGLGTYLPQVPPHIRSDPVSYQEWLSVVQARFKSWTTPLDALGVFRIYETPWFLLLLGALAFTVLVSLSNRATRLIRPLHTGRQDLPRNTGQAAFVSDRITVPQAVGGAWAAIEARFERAMRRVWGDETCVYGSQNAWASAIVLLIYVGLLFLVSGLAINGRWGWQQSGIRLLPGQPVFVGREASHKIELLDTGNESEIILEVGEGQRITLRPQVRTAQDGSRYQLTDQGGPLVQLSAQRGRGEKLTLYDYAARPTASESLQFTFSPDNRQDEKDRFFIVSDEKVVGRLQWLSEVSHEAGSIPRFRLWVFLEDGRTAVGETELAVRDNYATATIGDVTYNLKVTRYQVINVDHQPGLWALYASAVLLTLGLMGTLVPRYEIWLLISEKAGQVTIQVGDRSAGLSRRLLQRRRDVLDDLQSLLDNA